MVTPITKYAKEILTVDEVKSVLVEAFKNLINGRPGPVWLSIPVDIQGFLIDIDEKKDFSIIQKNIMTETVSFSDLKLIYNELLIAKRPLIIAGNGIKLGNCTNKFDEFIKKYRIPVVVTILATDIIESDNDLYAGKIGLIGDRSGNFTMQNCDLLISFGCRMAQGIIGYRSEWFAREARIVYIDNDPNELEKTNLNYHLKINMDLNLFFDNYKFDAFQYTQWIQKCCHWKNKWLFEIPPNKDENTINPYFALKEFFNMSPPNKITIASSGSIVTNVWHMVKIKNGDKFIHSSQGDMGFELPAAIGAQIANPDKMVISILGEGSFQLNIQELQSIIQYKLPIKILVFNNGAYGAIQITQTNFFKNKFGVDYSSGLSFPDTKKIAHAYGLQYISARNNEDIEKCLDTFISCKEAIIFEVFCCIQVRYPRLNAIKNDDGTFTNRPFEDMDPFLSREELAEEMIVKIV